MRYPLAGKITLPVLLTVMLVQGCSLFQGLQQGTNRGGEGQTFADAQTAATQSLATLFTAPRNLSPFRGTGLARAAT